MLSPSRLKAKNAHVAMRYSLLALLIGLIAFLSAGGKLLQQLTASAQTGSSLYCDGKRFDQLSSAAQTALERKYGKIAGPVIVGSSEQEAAAPLALSSNNISVNNNSADTTAQDTQSETTIALGAGSNVIVGFNDSGSNVGGRAHFTGYSVSSDGGRTFVDRGTLPDSGVGDAGDPVLARAATSGTVYLSTLGFNSGDRIQVFRSSDNGVTFAAPVNGAPGFEGTGDFQDKSWIAVDNFSGSGQGNVYLAWRNFADSSPGSGVIHGIRFTRSTDGGNTWGPNQGVLIAGEGSNNVQGAYVTVGPDHAVYVFWYDQSAGFGTPASIKMRKSTDLGVTFGSTVTVAALNATSTNGDLGLNGGFRTNSFPQAAVNPVNNNVYVVYNDDPAGVDKADVFFAQSTNGGSSWSAPTRVNNDATTNDQWQPALAVTPGGNALFVGFYDRRNDPGNSSINTFGSIATISGSSVTFGGNFRISSSSFPSVVGQDPAINTTYMGDYDQAVADSNFFYYTWGDNRQPSAVHQNQPDVRFAKIAVQAGVSATVSAASFFGSPLAEGSLVSGFGNGFTDRTEVTTDSQNLPKFLAGVNVTVVDFLGTSREAGMLVATPNQINHEIPVGTALGPARILYINTESGARFESAVDIARVAPGLFSANSTGSGLASGFLVRVRADGSQVFEGIARFENGQFVPIPIDFGPESDQLFLVLYGTGFRFRSSLSNVSVTTGGTPCEVTYAGPNGDGSAGSDQMNIRLPRSLAGRGLVDIVMIADGRTANIVQVSFR